MDTLLCFDDTDNLKSRGTGHLLADFDRLVEDRGWGSCSRISRHQLFLDPRVPYTSHNSAMCTRISLDPQLLQPLIDLAADYLRAHSAPGSDPGLCVTPVPDESSQAEVIEFGRRAKRMVLDKEQAYALAGQLGLHLSEHGGSGDGIIGALAGIGLRLSGNDGRFRGWFQIEGNNGQVTVGELLARPEVDAVCSPEREVLPPLERVALSPKLKTVLFGHRSVLLVKPCESIPGTSWQALSKEEVKAY